MKMDASFGKGTATDEPQATQAAAASPSPSKASPSAEKKAKKKKKKRKAHMVTWTLDKRKALVDAYLAHPRDPTKRLHHLANVFIRMGRVEDANALSRNV